MDGSKLRWSDVVSDEFLCVRCARHQSTCCQGSDIHVTLADVRRIAQHRAESGLQTSDFTEFRTPAYSVDDQMIEDPFWFRHVFRPDGTRRVLRQKENRDCTFLGEQGCTLPAETRPLVCRLYPFDYGAEGILPRLVSGCPVELLDSGNDLVKELQMSAHHAEKLRAQFYVEICESQSGISNPCVEEPLT